MDTYKWNYYPQASTIFRQWCRPISVISILKQDLLEGNNLKTSCRVLGGFYEKHSKFYLMNLERINGEEKLEVRVLVQNLPVTPVLPTLQCVEVFGNVCRIVSDEVVTTEYPDNINESVLNRGFTEVLKKAPFNVTKDSDLTVFVPLRFEFGTSGSKGAIIPGLGRRSQLAIEAKLIRNMTPNMAMHFNEQYNLLKHYVVHPPS